MKWVYKVRMFVEDFIDPFVCWIQKSRKLAEKAQIDAVFLRKIKAILKIIVPGFFSPEAGFLLLVASSLIARSVCDVWLIQNSTSIERSVFHCFCN